MITDLTASELEALEWVKLEGGVCIYKILEKTQLGFWGQMEVPGKRLLNKLVKKGLIILTEEEEDFSPMYDITPLGEEVLAECKR